MTSVSYGPADGLLDGQGYVNVSILEGTTVQSVPAVAVTQNVDQVLHAYGPEIGRSILSGFGTAFAFRLMDDASRTLVRQRFGANRKQIATYSPIRSQGVRQDVIIGSVVEDWDLSGLGVGRCIVSLPEGPPFFSSFDEYASRGLPNG